MKKLSFMFALLFMAAFIFYSCNEEATAPEENSETVEQDFAKQGWGRGAGNIVIANRGSGSISVVDAKTDEVTGTYSLPSGPNPPEPMYVVFVRRGQRVFVGDRANDQLVVFRASDFSVETTIPVGKGVFHMWADPQGRQLWVNNDIDNTTSVINLRTLQVITTVPTPADLVSLGGKPHDVILGPAGRFAYITLVGVAGSSDYVVQFNTRTFNETNRAAVGKDPHLSLTPGSRFLYVPCQNSNAVFVLNRFNLNEYKTIQAAGAHGAAISTNGRVFYTTNLPGGGTDGLYAISTKRNYVIGAGDTPYPVPHNIAITPNSKKLYVTHSGGTSDKVTIYKISKRNPIPTYIGEVTVGLNPFGLDYAK